MASVYILYSKTLDRYYVGSCKLLDERLEQHRNKIFSNSFTVRYEDWELFFALENLDYKQARLIELHIKKMKSRVYLENLRKYPEISEKLIRKYSN